MNPLRLFRRAEIASAAASGVEVVLHADRPLRLAGARGRRILCTSGCAWVTAPGVHDDIFLHDGETWDIASDGMVLLEAVGHATVALAERKPKES